MTIKREYTGVYITGLLFGAGLGLLIGSYIASLIESQEDEDEQVAEESDATSEIAGPGTIEDANKVLQEYRRGVYKDEFENLEDEEDTVSTKVDLAIAEYLDALTRDPRATPVHRQMVEQGLCTPEKMDELLDAAELVNEEGSDEEDYWVDEDEPLSERFLILTERPTGIEPAPRLINLVYYPEEEVLARLTTDGRSVAMTEGAIPGDIFDDAIEILEWSNGKQPAFIHDTDLNKVYSLVVSKLTLAPQPRTNGKEKPVEKDASEN